MKKIVYIVLFSLFILQGEAQTLKQDLLKTRHSLNDHSLVDSLHKKHYDLKIDTTLTGMQNDQDYNDWELLDSIHLNKVVIVTPLKFNSREERRDYLILRYKVHRVWPYAVMASNRLNALQERLDKIDTKSGKRKYTRRIQRYINNKFKDRLKKLSRTEGQILVKLMHRQIGKTTYDVVKDLRTGWRAFRYNITAKAFTISLKEKYDPYEVEEDYFIEHILRRSFQNNRLEEQDPAIDLDYPDILDHWQDQGNFELEKSQ